MGVHWVGQDIGMAVLGGALISFSSILNLVFSGRVTGLSGMFFTLLRGKASEGLVWKYSFMSGLLGVCYLVFLTAGRSISLGSYDYSIYDSNSKSTENLHVVGWMLGGFLVGVGTKLGNGCTSGHGVCGLSRLSMRSFVAVGTFMGTGVAIATFRHYVPFLDSTQSFGSGYDSVFRIVADTLIGAMIGGYLYLATRKLTNKEGFEKWDPVISFFAGVLFGLGLVLSGMCRRTKIVAFLTLADGWDPSLMFVMGTAIAINLPTWQYILRKWSKPILAESFQMPSKTNLDVPVVLGPALFGLGWGICGFCPGPGMVNLFVIDHAILFAVFLAIGQLAVSWYSSFMEKRKAASDLSTPIAQEK